MCEQEDERALEENDQRNGNDGCQHTRAQHMESNEDFRLLFVCNFDGDNKFCIGTHA